ncbi:MAG: Nudix family hydrolase [Lamprobacter sp.]|uniref:Nudix family hydrolase n=1 Tax=Lamprobacter sp. TaxID=3100796 RepID=UPI002B259F04|nr:Nudix family hydrolase [Lamprobacter sp.]MEA3640189.1 Nudix family hydrolase [Lamprobacter sp.]
MSQRSGTLADPKLIHVAAGVISDAQGRVLIAKRPIGTHQGGLWEFPGGKLEPGEPAEQGLARELDEELGIQVRASRPLIRLRHDYGDRLVLLDIHRVLSYQGHPQGREGQALDWLLPADMQPEYFPAADRPVISALRLPSRYLITGPDPRQPDAFLARLSDVLDRSQLRILQLRAPGLAASEYAVLARRCAEVCQEAKVQLVLNCDLELANTLPGDGLHLTEARLVGLAERPRLSKPLLGASCHRAEALAKASALGLDYALLSPVQRTGSHPEATPLGWRSFAQLVDQASLPVYALGGVDDSDLEIAIQHGAQGIAAISGFWLGSA